MFETILHPTDFSATAGRALDQAVMLAKAHRSTLRMLHVHQKHSYPLVEVGAGEAMLDDAYEAIGRSLERKARMMLTDEPDLKSSTAIVFRHGESVMKEIVDEALENNCDLIVMGAHGDTDIKEYFLGSVVEKVVRFAPCPVLVCGRGQGSPSLFKKILVPVDFSAASRNAAETALKLARKHEGAVQFLHAAEFVPPPYAQDAMGQKEQPLLLKSAQEALSKMVDSLDTDGVETDLKIVKGPASDAIVEIAHKDGYDLIAMGGTGSRGISRFLFGSTCARVLGRTEVPVLTATGSA